MWITYITLCFPNFMSWIPTYKRTSTRGYLKFCLWHWQLAHSPYFLLPM
ncbi:unnamed protein product [Prunus brigantina]